MKTALKVLLILVVVGLVGVAGFCFGYFQGYVGGQGHLALLNASDTARVLSNIRSGKTEDAITTLELALDLRLIEHVNYKNSSMQITKLFDTTPDTVFAKNVLAYRALHPSLLPDAEAQRIVQSALEELNE